MLEDLDREAVVVESLMAEELTWVLRQGFRYVCAGYRMFGSVSASSAELHNGAERLPDGVGPR